MTRIPIKTARSRFGWRRRHASFIFEKLPCEAKGCKRIAERHHINFNLYVCKEHYAELYGGLEKALAHHKIAGTPTI